MSQSGRKRPSDVVPPRAWLRRNGMDPMPQPQSEPMADRPDPAHADGLRRGILCGVVILGILAGYGWGCYCLGRLIERRDSVEHIIEAATKVAAEKANRP